MSRPPSFENNAITSFGPDNSEMYPDGKRRNALSARLRLVAAGSSLPSRKKKVAPDGNPLKYSTDD